LLASCCAEPQLFRPSLDMSAKVSIITAAYNSAGTISDTLESIDSQTYLPFEHLIIDGGSDDSTLAVAGAHARPYRSVWSEPDNGIYDAMNKGLLRCTGDIIGLLNSDDLYARSTVIRRVVELFDSNPAIDAIYGDLCYVSANNIKKTVRYWRSSDYRSGLFESSWVPPHPTFFARRRVYEQYQGFNLSYRLAADWELLFRFIEVHRIKTVHIPEVLVHMRLGGATNQSWRNVLKQNQEILKAAHSHGVPFSRMRFLIGKLQSRTIQYFARSR
jgi:glycosyltransferase involved in cell wall biosynthesis